MNSPRLKKLLIFILSLSVWMKVTAEESKPNFVIILADDLGYGDLSCYGGKQQTPILDQLAQEGMKFTDFHSNGCCCTPSRAALLTGRYPQRTGLVNIQHPGSKTGLRASEYTFASALQEAGYATAVFGKWHVGSLEESNPTRQGFDEFVGHLLGDIDYFTHKKGDQPDWWRGTNLQDEKGYSTALITDHAIDFISRKKAAPFCLYIAFNAVHYPIQDPVTGEQRKDAATYLKMIQSMDQNIGRFLKALKDQGLTEHTLVFFSSDNGARKQTDGASVGPLRGFKFELYEGGHRVPAIASWPGHIPVGTQTDEVAMLIDLMPTFLDLASVKLPTDRKVDGLSLVPTLLQQRPMPPRAVYWDFRDQSAMRQGPWKLVITKGKPELFNLEKDLGEKVDLVSQQSERVQQMIKNLNAWTQDVSSETSKASRQMSR